MKKISSQLIDAVVSERMFCKIERWYWIYRYDEDEPSSNTKKIGPFREEDLETAIAINSCRGYKLKKEPFFVVIIWGRAFEIACPQPIVAREIMSDDEYLSEISSLTKRLDPTSIQMIRSMGLDPILIKRRLRRKMNKSRQRPEIHISDESGPDTAHETASEEQRQKDDDYIPF